MTAPSIPTPTLISLPPEFRVQWPSPEAAALPWMQDRQHVPEPMTPMSGSWAERFAVGFNRALEAYSVPMRVHTARFNSYYYMAIAPYVPPEQMPEYEARAERLLMDGLTSFARRWEQEWLPELQQTWANWEKHDLSAASTAKLLSYLDEATAIFERVWEIHFLLLIPAMIGFSGFQDMYAEITGSTGALDAYRLLQGFDSKSIEAGRALWALSRKARADATVVAAIGETPARRLPAKLAETAAGRAFLEHVDGFLQVFGKRSDTVQELLDPSWVDDPTPVYDNLKAYIKQDSDPDVKHRELAEERERLVAEARARLTGMPEEVRQQFEVLLAAAQACSVVQEDHNYWIDQRSVHEMRHLCLGFGRRLVASAALDRAEDVFGLTIPEIRDLLAGQGADARSLIAARRAEMDRYRQISAPPAIGTDYGPPPDNPITRALMRFFGGPPEESQVANEIRGNAGSAGKVRGTARVIITITEAGRLQPGEILVTATTSPPWTPLFATAGGIVTDTGGPLSHCAIVAREYAIPAVVGTGRATSAIRDGQLIEVDGDHGVVRILAGIR